MSRRRLGAKEETPIRPGAPVGGQPSYLELNPDIMKRLVNSIRMGNYIAVAARQYGVSPVTVHRWIARGISEPESIYGAFGKAVDQALAESEARDLASLDAAANGRPAQYERDKDGNIVLDKKGSPIKLTDEVKADAKWAAWKLERRARRRWGQTEAVQMAPEQELPIDVTPTEVSADQKAIAIKDTREVLEALDELESE